MPITETMDLERQDLARMVFGHRDEHLRLLESELTVDIHARGTRLTLSGDPDDVKVARRALEDLYGIAQAGRPVFGPDVRRVVEALRANADASLRPALTDRILTHEGRTISPKTIAQKQYVDRIRSHDIVFGLGPAGTGKTYLAVALAVDALNRRQVRRVILTRPAVEAGEKLGFLPGDMAEKVSPYLRPLYDAMHEMMDAERIAQFTERGVIEIAPLAFMRGRTLNDAFVILDEAQNTTRAQMKMFLTRLGVGSKAVITGDLSQVDLDRRTPSGLDQATRILAGVDGIAINRFSELDVVRHPLVRRIIAAYDADDVSEAGETT